MTMAPNPNLQLLSQAGVSIWLDTLSRGLLQTGGFAGLIDDYGVTGATSNPAIFAKAITAPAATTASCASWLRAGSVTRGSGSSRSRSTTSARPPAC
jgi:transaldolase